MRETQSGTDNTGETYHFLDTLTLTADAPAPPLCASDAFSTDSPRSEHPRIEPSTAHPEMSAGQREGKAAQRHHFNTRHPPIA